MKSKLALIVLLAFLPAVALAADHVVFEKIVVDRTFRAEGVATGDIDHDGRLDILSGDVWYSAPDFKMHEVRTPGNYDGAKGYSNCFANFAQDVNGDGWIDSIVIGLPQGPCLWYENPQNKPGHWKQRTAAKSACNETPIFVDLNGDGIDVLVFGVRPEGIIAWFAVPKDIDTLWDMHVIAPGPDAPGSQQYSHGLGSGDVNRDGRNDILVKQGWWEAPKDPKQPDWKFHPANLGPDCANLLVYDVDDDGDSDVITSSAHNYGIWWFEQLDPADGSKFAQHLITKEYSQAHAIILADVNHDGIMDLVTGKRHFAHQGHDPGGKDPAMLYWIELLRPEKGKVEFVTHVIDDDSGVGTQFEVVDMNADGKADIVTSNKKGVRVFLQK
ncbi:MAG: VCBS repeat-containing protein [Sedimentisphaerales bacterium]|nr:VCBS repeat-containing protein [Sedimentisphaerales bacterium]